MLNLRLQLLTKGKVEKTMTTTIIGTTAVDHCTFNDNDHDDGDDDEDDDDNGGGRSKLG